ncbi:hypothetical protein V1503_19260 [Bacillus sp. SCS-151]|uniref:hypothetical protein n=1 Tax=Nanhaiella sioensis TaxID=3115293 RepID=UPI00397BE8B5
MKDWYVYRVQSMKKDNMKVYYDTLMELFNKKLSWNEVENLGRDQIRELTITFENNITMAKSMMDIEKLSSAIQNSRSGAGGCAITEFECAFCGEMESWGNTSTPKICRNCAYKMAKNIMLHKMDILKD